MKMKKAICTVLAVLMVASLFVPFSAASVADDNNIYFEGGVSGNEAACVKLRANRQGEGFCLVLPSTVSSERLTVHFDGTLSIDGTPLVSGEETDVFADKETVSAVINGEEASIEIFQSTLPAIFVSTKSGSFNAIDADKSVKEKGKIVVADSDTVYYNGALKQIKGRGNATWNYAKKPYNIKLDSGAALLGMKKSKNWCLIASYLDYSFLRNRTASQLAELFGTEFASDSRAVVLYRNGKYNGIYLLTEKVEIDKNRLNITNLEKLTETAVGDGTELDSFPRGGTINGCVPDSYKYVDIPNDPEDITGGYLLELELDVRYPNEVSGFVTKRGVSVVIKEPEYASKAQVEYIRNYYQDFEDALFSANGKNSSGKHYSEYIDMQSFADLYILNDLAVNLDTGITSSYIYKEAGKVMRAGPVWDYDSAFGNNHPTVTRIRYGYDLCNPQTNFVREGIVYVSGTPVYSETCDHIYNALYDHADFEELVYETWTQKFIPNKEAFINGITEAVSECENDVAADNSLWKTNAVRANAASAYRADCAVVTSFIEARSDYLSLYYAQEHTAVPHSKYDDLHPNVDEPDDDIDEPDDDINEPDDGTDIPGDTEDGNNSPKSLWDRIKDFFKRIADFFRRLFGKKA